MIAYVAAALPLRARAQRVAAELREAGIRVASSWHGQSTATVEAERRLTDAERAEIAEQCRAEIRTCDVLVIILGPTTTRHGSFVEAELARHLGKRVVALRPYGASELFPLIDERIRQRSIDYCARSAMGIRRGSQARGVRIGQRLAAQFRLRALRASRWTVDGRAA